MSATNPIVAEIASGPVTQSDLKRIESKLDAALSALALSTGLRSELHVLNLKQTLLFTGCRNQKALKKWLESFAPLAKVGGNRYSVARLKTGRERELQKAGVK